MKKVISGKTGACLSGCPYELQIPCLLWKNPEDCREVPAGNRSI